MIYQNCDFADILTFSHGKTINSSVAYIEDSLTPSRFSHFSYFQKEKSPCISTCTCNYEKMNKQIKERERRKEGGRKEEKKEGRKEGKEGGRKEGKKHIWYIRTPILIFHDHFGVVF